jgi:hypothetical protein
MIRFSTLQEFLFFTTIFFLTLQGLYIHSLGFSPFIIIGIAICILSSLILKTGPLIIKNIDFVPIFLLFTIMLIATFNSVIYGGFDIKRFLGFLLFLPLYISLLKFKIFDPLRFIKYVLIIHIAVFYLQFFLYYGFSIEFDPIKDISGRSQKGWGGSYNIPYLGKVIRFGGLFNEPGSYSTFVALLASLLNIKFYEYKGLLILASISMMLSFSSFGLIFSFILFLSILARSKTITKIIAIFLFIFITAIISDYFFIRFFSNDISANGVSFRLEFLQVIYDKYLSNISYTTFFGLGFFNTDINNALNFDNPINDVGLLIYIFATMGLVGTCVFIMCALIISQFRFNYFLPFLILLLSKFSLTWPLFVIMLFFLTRSDKIIHTSNDIN